MIICSKDSYIIPTYRYLQNCLYKGLCHKLSTNYIFIIMKRVDNIIATQGLTNLFVGQTDIDSTEKRVELIKTKLREFFNLKNVNFLLGAGTSSGAIDTMSELYKNLKFSVEEEEEEKEFKSIVAKEGENLENILKVMYSARNYYNGIQEEDAKDEDVIKSFKELYDRLITKVENHIFNSINVDFATKECPKVLGYYTTFYQKLAMRNKDLYRIRVFTTNNDLFNETALDSQNIHYVNGFSGGLRKFFNPALFNYTWSKRMDTSIDKYEPIENLVYLYKIHGSINWRESTPLPGNYFEIEEFPLSALTSDKACLIYPTPTKQDKSLGAPYVDLFREFQNKLLEPHSVLFVIGYGFNDRHVNDIIYRALATNSTINIVIFSSKPKNEDRDKKPIFFVDDNRIFTFSGKVWDIDDEENEVEGSKQTINHFDYIVNELLPNLDAFKKEDNLVRFVNQLNNLTKDKK